MQHKDNKYIDNQGCLKINIFSSTIKKLFSWQLTGITGAGAPVAVTDYLPLAGARFLLFIKEN